MWYYCSDGAGDRKEETYITTEAKNTYANSDDKYADVRTVYKNVHGDLIRTYTAITVSGIPLGIIERKNKTLYMLCEICSSWVEERKRIVHKYIDEQDIEIDHELPATYDKLMDMMENFIGNVYKISQCAESTRFDDFGTEREAQHSYNWGLDKAVDEAGGWENYKRLKGITAI